MIELDLAAQQSASVPPAEYKPPASLAAMSVPEVIVQGSPQPAAPTWNRGLVCRRPSTSRLQARA